MCVSFQDTFKVVFAPFEADHQLVSLQRAGIIDIILSEDGDLTNLHRLSANKYATYTY